MVARLSIVIPHWPLDDETDEALGACVASLPRECERIVVVNEGTGYARNVNVGLRIATGEYVAVVNNDCRLDEGNLQDLCIPDSLVCPLVIGERQGYGQSIGEFHGCFWVVPRPVLDEVGLLDERFEHAYWEDDDFIARIREAGFSIRRVESVHVRHIGGLTTVKVPEHRDWLEENERRFEEKWGWLPPPIPRYRRAAAGPWHVCRNCPDAPIADFEYAPHLPPDAELCQRCVELRDSRDCAFY